MNLSQAVRGALLALSLCLPGAVSAATIHDAGYTASDFNANNSWCSACTFASTQQIFAKLTLGQDYRLTGATWVSAPSYLSAATFQIWNEAHTTLVYSQAFLTTDITDVMISDVAVERTISLASVLLNSGTYLFSFVGTNNTFYGFGSGSDQFWSYGGVMQGAVGTKAAWKLQGVAAVPVPATLPLLAGAVLGFGALRRKRRG